MAKEKQSLKSGEKILFGIVGAFIVMATIAYIAMEIYRLNRTEPLFVTKTHFVFTEEGKLGSRLFREGRCTACHRALRNGTNMGLSLDGVGSVRTLDWLVDFLANPEEIYGARTFDHGPRPKEAAYVARMPEKDRHAIAVFISQLKAEQGSSSAPMPPDGRSEFIDSMVGAWAPEHWKEKYTDIRDKQPKASQQPDESAKTQEPVREQQ
ncbi:MAG: c-type cytochrome [Gammaproteobacteria bacterium]